MIIFKTFWRIMKRYWWIVAPYVVILTSISILNLRSNSNQTAFTDEKPEITIVDKTTHQPLTNNFLNYLSQTAELVKLDESQITDALFYQRTSLVVFLPENLETQILSGQKITLDYRTSGNYSAELAKNLISRYFELQKSEINLLHTQNPSHQQINSLINSINQKLAVSPEVHLTTNNITNLRKISAYFNAASYTIMAIILYITCLINATFNKTEIKKRTLVSSLHLKKYNLYLLLANSIFSFLFFIFISSISYFVLGNIIFTPLLVLYLSNTLLFAICCLTLAELISTIVISRDAVSGIVNLISLGSAFLSGAFISASFLPPLVLNIAHVLPSYWYINANSKIESVKNLNLDSISAVLPNFLMLLFFSLLFIVLNYLISKKQRQTNC